MSFRMHYRFWLLFALCTAMLFGIAYFSILMIYNYCYFDVFEVPLSTQPEKLSAFRMGIAPVQTWVNEYFLSFTFQTYGIYIVILGLSISAILSGRFKTIRDWIIRVPAVSSASIESETRK